MKQEVFVIKRKNMIVVSQMRSLSKQEVDEDVWLQSDVIFGWMWPLTSDTVRSEEGADDDDDDDDDWPVSRKLTERFGGSRKQTLDTAEGRKEEEKEKRFSFVSKEQRGVDTREAREQRRRRRWRRFFSKHKSPLMTTTEGTAGLRVQIKNGRFVLLLCVAVGFFCSLISSWNVRPWPRADAFIFPVGSKGRIIREEVETVGRKEGIRLEINEQQQVQKFKELKSQRPFDGDASKNICLKNIYMQNLLWYVIVHLWCRDQRGLFSV